jgi:type I restriction enzyme S subunit
MGFVWGLVTGTDFKDGYIDWDNCVYVEKNRFDQDKNIQLKIFDVLVTKDGTIGKVAFVDKLP